MTCEKLDFLRQLATFALIVRLQQSYATLSKTKIGLKKSYSDELINFSRFDSLKLLGKTITVKKLCQQINKMHRKLQRMCLALINR